MNHFVLLLMILTPSGQLEVMRQPLQATSAGCVQELITVREINRVRAQHGDHRVILAECRTSR
jgi:hypothetical protein